MTQIWCELVCAAGCGATTSGRFASGPMPRDSMKSDARSQGWLFEKFERTGRAFCCAGCEDGFKARKAAQDAEKQAAGCTPKEIQQLTALEEQIITGSKRGKK